MKPWQVIQGDCIAGLQTLPSESVQTCVTSPPYYGLRDYKTGTWEGGSPTCEHAVASGPVTERHNICRCGAVRVDLQIGLEPTPAEYIARMVEVFAEVKRTLRSDGTLWLNIGDSYASPTKGSGGSGKSTLGPKGDLQNIQFQKMEPRRFAMDGLKQKDIIGIPWMLAFALRADGWYLRQDIIWQKPNPMPESVQDRCTKAHEYVFLLSKSDRYYYDAEAIAEPVAASSVARLSQDVESQAGSTRAHAGGKTNGTMKAVGKRSGGASFGKQAHDATGTGQQSRTYERPEYLTRNCRSVWSIPTKSYHGAHFAVMPSALAERCILAGSKPGDTVLDPFAGSGTTLAVAVEHGRKAIGTELNPEYIRLIDKRIASVRPSLVAAEDTHEALSQ